jgi:integrase
MLGDLCPFCNSYRYQVPAGFSDGQKTDAPDSLPEREMLEFPLAVPVQRDRRKMSRRPGQKGTVVVRGKKFVGRWYEDIAGFQKRIRKSVPLEGAKNVTQARQLLDKIIWERGINTAAHLEKSRTPAVTFGQAAERWKEFHLIANKKPSSQRSMGCELNKHVLPLLKDARLEEVNYPLVRGFIQKWQKQSLSRKYIKNLFGIVRAVYNFTLDEQEQSGRSTLPPFLIKWQKVAPPKTVKQDEPCFTSEQMSAIVDKAAGIFRCLFAVAAGTGARAGELFGLRVEDVDLNEGTITIRRSVFEGQENTSKSDGGDKNRSRVVPIDSSVADEIIKHLGDRTTGYLFQTSRGTPLRLSNVLEDRLHPVLDELEIPRCGMHAFRHGRVSYLVYSGVSRAVIRDWIGHSLSVLICSLVR